MKIVFSLCVLFLLNQAVFSQVHLKNLENAYNGMYPFDECLEFFNRWSREYKSITPGEFENLTSPEKEVYRIFALLYKPFNHYNIIEDEINRLKYDTGDTSLNHRTINMLISLKDYAYNKILDMPFTTRYLLVQNQIRYGYIDTVDFHACIDEYVKECPAYKGKEKTIEDSLSKLNYDERILKLNSVGLIYYPPPKNWISYINNFHPPLDIKDLPNNNNNVKVLYQSALYDTVLNKFLFGENGEINYGRRQFIERIIPIMCYPNGLSYGFAKIPEIDDVVFLGSFKKAFASICFYTNNYFKSINFIVEKESDNWVIKYQW